MKKFFSIFVAVAVVFTLASCGGDKSKDKDGKDSVEKEKTPAPEEIAEQFLNYIAKAEFDKAKEMTTGDATGMVDMLNNPDSKPEPKDVKIENMKCVDKDTAATCTYKKDGMDGEITLKKVDKNWKVSSFPKEMPGLEMNGEEPKEVE